MKTLLVGPDLATYQSLYQHPVSRKLPWKDVRSMLSAVTGLVQIEHNGVLNLTLSGRSLQLHHPIRKSMADVQQLMDIRRFLGEPTQNRAE